MHLYTHETADPALPADLEREIFELTARLYPERTSTLSQVAKRVRAWVEPILYEVIIFRVGGQNARPEGHTQEFLPLSSYSKYVRHLLLGYTLTDREAEMLLSECTGAQDIALWTQRLNPVIVKVLGQLPNLQKLSTNVERLFNAATGDRFGRLANDPPEFRHFPQMHNPNWGITLTENPLFEATFGHELFRNLTHLDMSNPCQGGWRPFWCGLAELPRLTHLAFDFEFNPAVVAGCLEECRLLRVLVLVNGVFDSDGSKLREVSRTIAEDARVVSLIVDAFAKDWELGARKGDDFWAHAEADVEKRLQLQADSRVEIAPPNL